MPKKTRKLPSAQEKACAIRTLIPEALSCLREI